MNGAPAGSEGLILMAGTMRPHRQGAAAVHWTAVFLVAYAAGILELKRLCDGAPTAGDDAVEGA